MLELFARSDGDGPPVTLVHGFTTHGGAWDKIRAALQRRFRVLTVDLPGHGRSPLPPPDYDLPTCAADLVAAMARHGHTPGALIGYSMGGRVALAAALLAPRAVTKLVLESASPGLDGGTARTARRAADAALADHIEASDLADFIDRWQSQPLFHTQRRLGTAVRAAARSLRLDNDRRGLAAALRTLGTGRQPSFWHELRGLHLPVLLVTGEYDEKFERIARAMTRSLPDARHAIVPGAGHDTHLENPAAFLAVVETFVAGVGSRAVTAEVLR